MKRTCENCSRPLFDTDTVCWHCGHKQSLPVPSEATIEEPNARQQDDDSTAREEPEQESGSVTPALILFYGGLTAVIVIGLLLTSRSLGQSPTTTLLSDSMREDWVSLISPGRLFSIDIPAEWVWEFRKGKQSSSSFIEGVENGGKILASVNPWGDFVTDVEYSLVAENNTDLIVVARSERLNRLTSEQAVSAVRVEQFDNITVIEAKVLHSAEDGERAFIALDYLGMSLRCYQSLVPTSSEAYIVATCASPDRFQQQQEVFRAVLDSFRSMKR